jgi:hypothetical protein
MRGHARGFIKKTAGLRVLLKFLDSYAHPAADITPDAARRSIADTCVTRIGRDTQQQANTKHAVPTRARK